MFYTGVWTSWINDKIKPKEQGNNNKSRLLLATISIPGSRIGSIIAASAFKTGQVCRALAKAELQQKNAYACQKSGDTSSVNGGALERTSSRSVGRGGVQHS